MSTRSSVGLAGVSKKKRARVGPHGALPGGRVAAVDQRAGDAEARTQLLRHVQARAEHGARRHDVVAGLEEAQQRRRHRRHAGGRGARGFGAFQQAHALLEHGRGRVGEARVDEARVLVLEAGLGLLGAVVDERLGEEHRLRRLAELRAQRAAVHQQRLGAPGGGVGGSGQALGTVSVMRALLACPTAGNKKPANPAPHYTCRGAARSVPGRSPCARPFSELFCVAASRPAKSPRYADGDYRVPRLGVNG